MKRWLIGLWFAVVLAAPCAADDLYVSVQTGKNSNPGTKEQPLQDLHKALEQAKEGTAIHIAEGEYLGKLKCGYYKIEKNGLKLIGGYKTDFSARDPFTFQTKIHDVWPFEKKTQHVNDAPITVEKDLADIVIDGLVIDRSVGNQYKDGKLASFTGGSAATIDVVGAKGNVTIQNCVIVNSPRNSIQVSLYTGHAKIHNNIIANTSWNGIAVVMSKSRLKPPTFEITNNTVFFSWPTGQTPTPTAGSAILTEAGEAEVTIERNVLAFNRECGIVNARKGSLHVKDNVFYLNKNQDYYFFMDGNKMYIRAEEFGDADLKSESGNRNEDPAFEGLNKTHLENWMKFEPPSSKVQDTFDNELSRILGRPLKVDKVGGAGLLAPKLELKDALLFPGNSKVAGIGAQKVK